jgi:parallel beta-helix repeat protein
MARNKGFTALLAFAIVMMAWPLPAGVQASTAGTYWVTQTADSGAGTLRDAITWANGNAGADTINIVIAGCPANVCTIDLASPLPTLTDSSGVTITGYTQTGAAPASGNNPATLKIIVKGHGFDCLAVTSANNVIKGLVIHGCGYGVRIQGSSASANVVAGNHIGTDAAGYAAEGNLHGGVRIDGGAHHNTVGGDAPEERNVISGNDTYGVWIDGSSTANNTISGNFIGTGASGLGDLGNGYSGVHILNARYNTVGGDATGERNVISGNDRHGIYVRGSASSNTVAGNIIGGARDAAAAVANTQDGVRIEGSASYNTIGGDTTAEQNLILGNGEDGVGIEGAGAVGNAVSGNLIGLNNGDQWGMGNVNGVHIRDGADDNTVGGDTGGERNVISANRGYGVHIEGSGTTGNIVAGNYIGTGANGSYAPAELGNDGDGVLINNGASGNVVGGSTAGERNVIANNDWSGVAVYGSGTADNTVSGNYVGVDAAGTGARGNRLLGVYLGWAAQGNLIGGDTPGERNVIAGNAQDGVQVQGAGTADNVISGNWIGLRPDGQQMANGGDGVRIFDDACRNRIGGTVTGERNVVSGNTLSGVSIYGTGTMTNTVVGNYIGTNTAGTAAVGNTLHGVYVGNAANDNVIGGATAGARNLISGNSQDGVRIEHSATDNNQVSGNYIGTNANGTARLANVWHGVRITGGARTNTIGGSAAGEGNLISGNGQYGVYIEGVGTLTNVVSGNKIGTSAAGTSALGNTSGGVYVGDSAQYNTIGGTAAGDRNVISGNWAGVWLSGADTAHNKVYGNYIGLSASGTAAVANTWVGVYVASGADHNMIGGTAAGQRNVISGNGYHGVHIFGTDTDSNTLAGNYIGPDASGSAGLGNGREGVEIYGDCDNNVIGPGNLIAFNTRNGVYVDGASASGNRITQNGIHDNGLAGIDLANSANGNIAAPAITSFTTGSPATISGTACTGCTVEVFESMAGDGEGEVYLGSAVATGGTFVLAVGAVSRPYLTATASDATKGTSEFSAVFVSLFRICLPLVTKNWNP